jgi:hypothetical protein
MGLRPRLDRIYRLFKSFRENLDGITKEQTSVIFHECQFASNSWYSIGQLVSGVSKINCIQYLKYVPRLAGVSGRNSPMMIPLILSTAQVEKFFPTLLDEELFTQSPVD